jgi:hypothetical protein
LRRSNEHAQQQSITGPQADLNLGIITLLDGATTTQLTLDTSMPGQHSIEYLPRA